MVRSMFEGFETAMNMLTATYAVGYLCCKIARPGLKVPESSKYFFNADGSAIRESVRKSVLALGLLHTM